MAGTGRADRALGALLGVHAGDALGATVEFMPWSQVRERYPDGVREIVGGGVLDWPAGHATDDTDLTRAVLLAYLDPGDDVVRAAAEAMLGWATGDWPGRRQGLPPADIGAATAAGLDRYRSSGDPRAAGAGPGRAGNGSLMRCIPTALLTDRDERIRDAVEISAITHDDPRCTIACAAYVEMAAALLAGADPEAAVTSGHDAARELGNDAVLDAVELGARLDPAALAGTGPDVLPDGGGGYVLDSLSLAVAAVLDERPLPGVLVDVVRLGGDADTNGAIAGGLLGARDGAGAIPASWTALLQFRDEFTAAVGRLASSA